MGEGRGIYSVAMFHVGMDCAPFKKPSRKAGLFSYRSVIPPSPRETLLRKFSWDPGRPAGRKTCKRHIACHDFLQKIIVRSFCCSSLPRPVGRQHTALHSKSPAPWPGFLCCSPFKAARPAARAFPGENAHGSTALLAHLCRHSQLRGVTFV